MKRKVSFILLVTILLSTLIGCSSSMSSPTDENGSVKILLILASSGDTFRETLAKAAQDAAMSNHVQLDVVCSESSIETQASQIESAESSGYDIILCNPVSIDTTLQLEASAGDLPIVFINSSPDESLLKADKYMYVGSDEMVAGQYQAEYVLEKLSSKEEINVAIFKGEKGHPATNDRTESVKNALADSGKKINYVFVDIANWSTDEAKEMFNIFLSTKTPVDCVICNNDSMALGVIESCKENNIDLNTLPILGVDATSDGCKEIQNGNMAFTVYQSATGQGEAAVKLAVTLATGKSGSTVEGVSEDGLYIWVPFEKVDASNVANYIKK